jgi:hypothetical protein
MPGDGSGADAGPMNRSAIRQRFTFANVVAVLALFVALGGASYAATKINGKSIKKQSIAGNRLKADTVDGARINESTLGEVPSAAQAGSAGSATTAGHAETAGSATTADSAQSATSAATAENANALDGQSASQLRASSRSAISNSSCNPVNPGTQNVSCVALQMNLPATSDVMVIGSGGWYGQGAGPDKGECYISIDPNVNAPSSDRMEVGQVDAEHTDFDTAAEIVVHTTINDVPAGNQTFRFRCYEEDGDFKVENVNLTVTRLPS